MFGKNVKFNIAGGFPYFTFTVLAVIFSITFFLIFLSGLKQDKTTISIMFIPKNEQSASQMNYVLENAARLPRMLSFYEKIVSASAHKDIYEGLDPDTKKANWNKTLISQREDGSSIITLSVYSLANGESRFIAEQSAKTLISTISYYYNIEEEIDMRIVEGPLTQTVIRGWFLLLASSLIFGVIFAYLILVLSERMKNVLSKKFYENSAGSNLSKSAFKEINKNTGAVKSGILSVAPKVSGAPENLPILTMPNLPADEFPEISQAKAENEKEMPEAFVEPTDAEMKKRLNQLLRGGF